MKFNKYLSQLESMYQVAEPVVKKIDPIYISDFIHYIFEHQTDYHLEGLNKDWFMEYQKTDQTKAYNFVNNLLKENDHLISKSSIVEGIEIFKNES